MMIHNITHNQIKLALKDIDSVLEETATVCRIKADPVFFWIMFKEQLPDIKPIHTGTFKMGNFSGMIKHLHEDESNQVITDYHFLDVQDVHVALSLNKRYLTELDGLLHANFWGCGHRSIFKTNKIDGDWTSTFYCQFKQNVHAFIKVEVDVASNEIIKVKKQLLNRAKFALTSITEWIDISSGL